MITWRRFALEAVLFIGAAWLAAESAALLKRGGVGPALVALEPRPERGAEVVAARPEALDTIAAAPERARAERVAEPERVVQAAPAPAPEPEKFITPTPGFKRYYDGRPIRPARTIWMTVTAYSPDERSCGDSADGITATNHSVWTNAMRLVAADTRLLPFGSLLSIPGYADGEVVPVLDRGGAIKGKRLDVLYATHEIARKWGVRRLPVVVWEYADGKPAKIR